NAIINNSIISRYATLIYSKIMKIPATIFLTAFYLKCTQV
ncbi:MAG: hypothetical protein ACI8Y3_001188, partial [Paraglaciecola sp.]